MNEFEKVLVILRDIKWPQDGTGTPKMEMPVRLRQWSPKCRGGRVCTVSPGHREGVPPSSTLPPILLQPLPQLPGPGKSSYLQ